jgi:O-acetylhomoserine/O-acetylserine sulfhydrylase-like pyridoxal-dependent enzyme
MNERIRQIAREAGIKMAHDDTLALGYLDTAHKKFAELIVKECFAAAMIEAKGHMNPIDLMTRMKERVGIN